jgi:hypothetical protein
LIATVCELRRFVPVEKNRLKLEKRMGRTEEGERTFEDDTEGALADLPANAVMAADEIGRG